MKICSAVLKLWSGHENCSHTKGNNTKSRKTELRFMCSASRRMVFNVCVKFHENMSSSFKVMERTGKLFTHKGKPELQFLCSARRLMVFNVCVKFHENVSSSFKVMERTRK